MKKLRITAVSEIRQDKNGINFKQLTLQQQATFVDSEGELVTDITRTKSLKYNSYEQSYLDGSQDALYNEKVGGKVAGDIVQVDVPAYQAEERRAGAKTGNMVTLTKASLLVFGNSDDESFAAAVEKARERKIAANEKAALSAASVGGTSI